MGLIIPCNSCVERVVRRMRITPSYPVAARLTRVALAALLMSACAGCSNAFRFDGNPFSNPFLARADTTGSVRKAPNQIGAYRSAAPIHTQVASSGVAGRVSSAPLPAPGTTAIQQLRPRTTTQASAARLAPRPLSGGAPDYTGSIARKASAGTTAKAIPGWRAQGGTPVTLGRGETVEIVANRYGVPPAALLHVNGLSNSSQAVPGQKLIIPTYSSIKASLSPAVRETQAAAFAAVIEGNPFVVPGAPTHLAFVGDAEDGPRDALDDREVLQEKGGLSFADQDSVAGTRKIRSYSSIAAPISIKPPSATVAPKAPTVAPVAKAPAIASGPIKAAKPKIAAAKPVPVKAAGVKTATVKAATVKAAETKPAPAKIAAKPARILPAAPKVAAKNAPSKTATAKAPHQLAEKPKATPASDKAAVKALAATPAPGKIAAGKSPHQAANSKIATAPAKAPIAVAPSKVATAKTPVKPETLSPEISAYAADPAATGSLPPTAVPPSENGLFRWPARGRVISSFGSKDTAGTNNGINISMPEGTPVKAAEAGTVAYSGDDIKKYGKLVLIKHENGYVSAYAHNGELDVRKGEAVKRGQIIAKSGATGDVTSPQLHFQLRKGEQPIDPIKLLDTN